MRDREPEEADPIADVDEGMRQRALREDIEAAYDEDRAAQDFAEEPS